MTKLFVQMLLSVVLGVSVGLNLKADSKAKLHQSLGEVGVTLRETAQGAVQNFGDIAARVNAALSVKADTEASSETRAEAEIKVKNNVNVNTGNGFPIHNAFLSDLSLEDTFDYKSRTNAEADLQGQDVEITEKTKSSLNLDLDAGE